MTKQTNEIKNTIKSHLARTMFGMNIYGLHEHTFFDGKENRVLIIEVKGATRFERYGRVTVYHPHLGKWTATLLSERHAGKPVQVLTTEEIQENIKKTPTAEHIYKVYGRPEIMPEWPAYDPYWQS